MHHRSKAKSHNLRPNWCGFGDVFPNGDMRLLMKTIDKDDYPCGGVRVLQEGKPMSDEGVLCCGKTQADQWVASKTGVTVHVDASKCQFKAQFPRPVWMTSLKGTSSHWSLAGVNAYRDPNQYGFNVDLLPVDGVVTTESAENYAYELQWYTQTCTCMHVSLSSCTCMFATLSLSH